MRSEKVLTSASQSQSDTGRVETFVIHRLRMSKGQNWRLGWNDGSPKDGEKKIVAFCIRARSLYALLRDLFIHAYIRVNSTTCV